MVTKYKAVFIGVVLVALSGCGVPARYADRPYPTRFDRIEQPKLQSAGHWQAIAANVAQDVVADLGQKNLIKAPIYIPRDQDDFAFVEGFTELLTTSLVAQGLDVRTCIQRTCGGTNATGDAPNALVLDVRYSAYAFQPRDIYYTGQATTLMAGLFTAGGIIAGGSSVGVSDGGPLEFPPYRYLSWGAKLLGVTALADASFWASHNFDTGPDGKYMGQVPKTEILVTASVTQGDRIVVRRSNVYFTSDEDAALYWNQRPSPVPVTTLPVKGEK
ncbi:MAG: hypothetical protein LBE85_13120 [Candidatus Accumulibacter sp.]|jgi:hypothetical protein|nr:hypothetical protein [Accumulibacter sp.]